MQQFDHFVLAAPDLQEAKQAFAELSGCMPADGGAHKGLGTHNALCSFGPESYLEIVAPDPQQALDNPITRYLAGLPHATPLHWAIRSDDLQDVAQRALDLGISPGPIRATTRAQPDGTELNWQLMGLGPQELGGLVPFFIDWLDCPHPATTTPVAGTVRAFTVSLPAGPLQEVLKGTSGVEISSGQPGLSLTVDSAKGEISWQTERAQGFTL
ncbi:MAG: VOC family protein [Pseudomonadota bacterium]